MHAFWNVDKISCIVFCKDLRKFIYRTAKSQRVPSLYICTVNPLRFPGIEKRAAQKYNDWTIYTDTRLTRWQLKDPAGNMTNWAWGRAEKKGDGAHTVWAKMVKVIAEAE